MMKQFRVVVWILVEWLCKNSEDGYVVERVGNSLKDEVW